MRIARWVVGAALLTFAPGVQAAPADGPSILGGEPVTVGQWPTVVGIVERASDNLYYLCTGTLIAPRWVLTAAHCVDPTEWGGSQQALTDATTVVLDSNDVWRVTGTRIRAVATMASPGFDDRTLSKYDVGLIELATPVSDRAPIPLNRHTSDAPPGIHVSMVGFGRTNPNSGGGALYWLADKPSVACETMNLSDAFLLCFDQRDMTGQCFGDSGGPTLATIGGVTKQIGIASFGEGAASCTGYAAQTRVDAVFNWVADQLGGEWRCADDDECSPRCGAYGNPIDPDCAACATDEDCGFQKVCQDNHACGPAPLTAGGLGSTCTMDGQCGSASCLTRGGESLCSQACTPAGDECPAGFDCADGACWPTPPDSGGCTAAPRSGGSPAALLLALLLALPRRRRR